MDRDKSLDQILSIFESLTSESDHLRTRPWLLWQQLYNGLKASVTRENPSTIELMEKITKRKEEWPGAWFELLNPDSIAEREALDLVLLHQEAIRCCDVVTYLENRFIAAAGDDGAVYLYSYDSGARIEALAGHQDAVLGCSFSSDGRMLVSVGADGKVILWDVISGQRICLLGTHADWAISCRFGPFDEIVSTAWDGSVYVWSVTGRHKQAEMKGHADPVSDCDFSSSGRLVATTGWNGTARVWDVDSGKEVARLERDVPLLKCRFFSDSLIAIGDYNGMVCSWHFETDKCFQFSGHHWTGITGLDTCGGTELIVSGGWDKTIRLWSVQSRSTVATIHGHGGEVTECRFVEDGRRILTASVDGSVKLWDTDKCLSSKLEDSTDAVTSCAVSPDGRSVAVAFNTFNKKKDSIALWDAQEATAMDPIGGEYFFASDLCFSDKDTLFAASPNGKVKEFDIREMRETSYEQGEEEDFYPAIKSCAVSEDGNWLASTNDGSCFGIWDLEEDKWDGFVQFTERCSPEYIVAVPGRPAEFAVSMTEQSLDFTNYVRTLEIVRGSDGKNKYRVKPFIGPNPDVVLDISVSPDGKFVAAACRDGSIAIWDMESLKLVRKWTAHDGSANACTWSKDEKYLLSGGSNMMLVLWSVPDCMEIAAFPTLGPVTACALGPGGNIVCCGDASGKIYLLKLRDLQFAVPHAPPVPEGKQQPAFEARPGPECQDTFRKFRELERIFIDKHLAWFDASKDWNQFVLAMIVNIRQPANTAFKHAKRFCEDVAGGSENVWDFIAENHTRDEWMMKKAEKRKDYFLHPLPACYEEVYKTARLFVDEYGGDAKNLWEEDAEGEPPLASEVRTILEKIWRGPKRKGMLLGVLFDYGLVRGGIDLEKDTHTTPVLGRILRGRNLKPREPVDLGRKLHPENPWFLDSAIYGLSRGECNGKEPQCGTCYLNGKCLFSIKSEESGGAS